MKNKDYFNSIVQKQLEEFDNQLVSKIDTLFPYTHSEKKSGKLDDKLMLEISAYSNVLYGIRDLKNNIKYYEI